ncbi:uncharacterized protein LOC123583899 [Leopardus geoffroyi]|uniref:uncharacterized protein LOC123583899 n=1 Tax=Leopardus geoffroyi TaxID=46844 RepID=UPI001E25D412|nr:uncharacterized protein LOC123583899 [Leopardus geoffroyi]
MDTASGQPGQQLQINIFRGPSETPPLPRDPFAPAPHRPSAAAQWPCADPHPPPCASAGSSSPHSPAPVPPLSPRVRSSSQPSGVAVALGTRPPAQPHFGGVVSSKDGTPGWGSVRSESACGENGPAVQGVRLESGVRVSAFTLSRQSRCGRRLEHAGSAGTGARSGEADSLWKSSACFRRSRSGDGFDPAHRVTWEVHQDIYLDALQSERQREGWNPTAEFPARSPGPDGKSGGVTTATAGARPSRACTEPTALVCPAVGHPKPPPPLGATLFLPFDSCGLCCSVPSQCAGQATGAVKSLRVAQGVGCLHSLVAEPRGCRGHELGTECRARAGGAVGAVCLLPGLVWAVSPLWDAQGPRAKPCHSCDTLCA